MNEQSASAHAENEVRLEGPRPARLDEREELLAMINLVFRTSVGRPPTIASDWVHVYAPENLGNISVMCDAVQGRLVASTGVWVSDVVMGGVTLRVGGINCVGALADYRRHGLGSQVMQAAQARMRELGCQVGLLSTGIANWYRRLGWEEAGQWRTYAINRGNVGLLPPLRPGLKLRVVELTAGETGMVETEQAGTWQGGLDEALLALYHQQRFGAQRTAAGFRQRLAARSYTRIFVAEEGERVAAYLLHHPFGLLEWAGEAGDVAALARAAFESLDDPQASTSRRAADAGPAPLRNLLFHTPVQILGQSAGELPNMAALLDQLRLPCDRRYLGMLYLIDPQAIMEAFGLTDVEIRPLADERYLLRVGPNEIELDRHLLTKHLFGLERVCDVGGDLFPLPLCQWYLEQV